MGRGFTMPSLLVGALLLVGCVGADSEPTTSQPSTLPTESAATTTSATTTAEAPTTSGPNMARALTPYQAELVGLRLELEALLAFAQTANSVWDEDEGSLTAAQRTELFGATDRKLTVLCAWVREVSARVDEIRALAGTGTKHTILQGAAERLVAAADAAHEGLHLRNSEESIPGTMRREALEDLSRAVGDLNQASLDALGAEIHLTEYEEELTTLRLVVGGLVNEADEVNRRWDQREVQYARAEWDLVNLEARVLSLADSLTVVAATSPTTNNDLSLVVEACHELEASAAAMLEGLRLPLSDEEDPGAMRLDALERFREAAVGFDRAAVLAAGTPEAWWTSVPVLPSPRLEAPDVDPPTISVTAPASRDTVVANAVIVSGTTEPGAYVTVAGVAAAVDQAGAWTARVSVQPGVNGIHVVAMDPAQNVASVQVDVLSAHTLSAMTIGPAKAGDPPDGVVAQFTALFGPPSRDERVEDPLMPYGYWADEYARFVFWDDAGLFLAFTDGGQFRDDGEPHLISWAARSRLFATPEGIHVGSTVAEARNAYGADLHVINEECAAGEFYVGQIMFGLGTLGGRLTGPPFNDASVVTGLFGGVSATC